MQSRLWGIKKINILIFVCVFNASLFFSSIFFSLFVLEKPDCWFYFFLFFVGLYLLTKSFLYKSDANCYFGFSLFFLGIFLFLNSLFYLDFLFIAIVLAFALSSVFTFIFFRQFFHLIYGLNFFFWCASYYLFRQNFFNLAIFFALIIIFVFIFSLIYAKIRIVKK